jgi:long-chain acyl-CoA synthetase
MQNRFHELLVAANTLKPDEISLIDQTDQSLTWRDLENMTRDAYQQLQAFGVRPGDRIVLVLENNPAVIAFLFAASQSSAIVVPINARLTETEINRILDHSDPSVVVFTVESSTAADAHAKNFAATRVAGAFGEVSILKRSGSTAEDVYDDGIQQVAVLMYTSGTTGSPKAAMLTHGNLLAAALSTSIVRGMTAADICFVALPLSHIYGLVTLLAMSMAQGTIRLQASFAVERLYKALQTDVTLLPGVPQMHAHLFHFVKENNLPNYNYGILRYVSSGGAPMDPAWKRQAEAFYGLPLQNGYGLTEGAAGVCTTNNKLGDPDISVGYAMHDCVLKLDMTASGSEPDKGIGEVHVGGPQIMQGYFRDKQQTAEVLDAEGFFRTGDLGCFDNKGRLHIVGRSKELIIRSGFNVYPNEIEATLTEHPEVIVAGVVGRAQQGNEEVLGFVKVSVGCTLTEQELKRFVHDKLAPYKRPSRIIVATELPVAVTGKIMKSKLLESFIVELSSEY